MALVHCNIAAFRCEPTTVTIGGESAAASASLASCPTTPSGGLTPPGICSAVRLIESGAYMYHDVPSLATYQPLAHVRSADATLRGGTLTLACLQGLNRSDLANERDFWLASLPRPISARKSCRWTPYRLRDRPVNHVPLLQVPTPMRARLFEPTFFPRQLTAPFGTTATSSPPRPGEFFRTFRADILCASPAFLQPWRPALFCRSSILPPNPRHATPSTTPTSPFNGHSSPPRRRSKRIPIANFHNFVPQQPPRPDASQQLRCGNVDERSRRSSPILCVALRLCLQTADLSTSPGLCFEFNDPNPRTGPAGWGGGGGGRPAAPPRSGALIGPLPDGASRACRRTPVLFTGSGRTSPPRKRRLATPYGRPYWVQLREDRQSNDRGNAILSAFKRPPRRCRSEALHTPCFRIRRSHGVAQGLSTPQGPIRLSTFIPDPFLAHLGVPLLTFSRHEPQQPGARLQSRSTNKASIARASEALPHGRAFLGARRKHYDVRLVCGG